MLPLYLYLYNFKLDYSIPQSKLYYCNMFRPSKVIFFPNSSITVFFFFSFRILVKRFHVIIYFHYPYIANHSSLANYYYIIFPVFQTKMLLFLSILSHLCHVTNFEGYTVLTDLDLIYKIFVELH